MTTIQLTTNVKHLLDEFATDESINEAVNRLLDLNEPSDEVFESGSGKANIRLHESTFERLKTYKSTTNESHSDTILRLLMNAK